MPLAAMQSAGWGWSCFLAGSGGPAGGDFGAWCRDHLSSSGEWQCPWLIISHWGGADGVLVVTPGVLFTGHQKINETPGEILTSESELKVFLLREISAWCHELDALIRWRFRQAHG